MGSDSAYCLAVWGLPASIGLLSGHGGHLSAVSCGSPSEGRSVEDQLGDEGGDGGC